MFKCRIIKLNLDKMSRIYFLSLLYLSKVVKVVFVMNPSILGSQTVGFVGNVLHIQAHTVVELAFEELGRKAHTHTKENSRQTPTKIHSDEAMTAFVCSHFFHTAFEVIS